MKNEIPKNYLFTSESVTEGHPDKVADQISDAVLDAIYAQDPFGRVACETSVTTGLVLVYGQITTNCYIDIPKIVRETVKGVGYTRAKYGFDGETCAVLTAIDEQSPDIAMGVNKAYEVREEEALTEKDKLGAGDQGMMFGYACDETTELMPMPIQLAHGLTKQLATVRKKELLPFLRPDGKSQVTIEYKNGKPYRAETIVIAAQHNPEIEINSLRHEITEHVIKPVIPEYMLASDTKIYINPTGRFVIGGPTSDAGLTGRKIEVDTYGGMSRHGGGAFSGKDPTKVDRSGAYFARYVAKNIVAAGLAQKVELQVSYAIGVAQPVSIHIDTFGTGVVDNTRLTKVVSEVFDFRPGAIIEKLKLRQPLYKQIAAYGHFGRSDLNLPWEETDMVAVLKSNLL